VEAIKAKKATKRELIVVATTISRMIGTPVFSDRTEFSVTTDWELIEKPIELDPKTPRERDYLQAAIALYRPDESTCQYSPVPDSAPSSSTTKSTLRLVE
jgi:hypothetical protein